jgi:hypothetical protein
MLRIAQEMMMFSIYACIVDYVIPDMVNLVYDAEDFPQPSKTDYTERGWNHPQFAALLYPMLAIDNLYSEDLMCVTFSFTIFLKISESSYVIQRNHA